MFSRVWCKAADRETWNGLTKAGGKVKQTE